MTAKPYVVIGKTDHEEDGPFYWVVRRTASIREAQAEADRLAEQVRAVRETVGTGDDLDDADDEAFRQWATQAADAMDAVGAGTWDMDVKFFVSVGD